MPWGPRGAERGTLTRLRPSVVVALRCEKAPATSGGRRCFVGLTAWVG
jgi:hypothetical protein